MYLFQYVLDTLFMVPFILVRRMKGGFGIINQSFTFRPKFCQP